MSNQGVGAFGSGSRLALCCTIVLLSVACSDPDGKNGNGTAGAAGNTAGAAGAGVGGSSAGTSGTAGVAGGPTGPVCNELELDAPPVGLSYDAQPAPEATGGQLLDGTYFLTKQIVYSTPSGITIPIGRTEITVMGDVWQEVLGDPEKGSVNPDRHYTRALAVSGTTLTLSRTCPSEAEPNSAEYSVTQANDGFVIYVEDRGKRIGTVFTRQ